VIRACPAGAARGGRRGARSRSRRRSCRRGEQGFLHARRRCSHICAPEEPRNRRTPAAGGLDIPQLSERSCGGNEEASKRARRIRCVAVGTATVTDRGVWDWIGSPSRGRAIGATDRSYGRTGSPVALDGGRAADDPTELSGPTLAVTMLLTAVTSAWGSTGGMSLCAPAGFAQIHPRNANNVPIRA